MSSVRATPAALPAGMKIAFDIVHPADVLFYLRPIRSLLQAGHEVCIASRHKDVTTALLDGFDLAHTPLSTAASNLPGLAAELLVRNSRFYRFVRREKPDVLTGFGGVAAAHVGCLTGTPSVVHYDSDAASLQTRIAFPFVSELHVPRAYTGNVPAGRTFRFRGVKELSYLHPAHFTPDLDTALANGLDPYHDNFFVRVVSWRASHDVGRDGWDEQTLDQLTDFLGARGRVHISSERPLPQRFSRYLYRGDVTHIHHLLGHCRLYVGESATMCSEAVVLGVPAVYCSPLQWGYIRELEQAGLIISFDSADGKRLVSAAAQCLDESPLRFSEARKHYLHQADDLAEYVVHSLTRNRQG